MKQIGYGLEDLAKLGLPKDMAEKFKKLFAMTVTISLRIITPDVAHEILTKMKNYRDCNEGWVKKFAQIMKDGRWMISQALYFDRDGNCHDGQHRLGAVVESGLPQMFLIVGGVPPNVAEDDGRPRSVADVLKAECGVSTDPKWISAILRRLNFGFTSKGEKKALVYVTDLYKQHKGAINFIAPIFPKKDNFIPVHSVGAFGRAYAFHKDSPAKLAALKLLTEKFKSEDWVLKEDKALQLLRNWIREQKGRSGGSYAKEAYGYTAEAIRAMLAGESPKTLKQPESDPFAIATVDIPVELYLAAS